MQRRFNFEFAFSNERCEDEATGLVIQRKGGAIWKIRTKTLPYLRPCIKIRMPPDEFLRDALRKPIPAGVGNGFATERVHFVFPSTTRLIRLAGTCERPASAGSTCGDRPDQISKAAFAVLAGRSFETFG